MQSESSSEDYSAKIIALATRRLGGSPPPGPPLQPPGGGGTYDGMLEARVASLEADVKNIRENVGEMRADLKTSAKDISDMKVSSATTTERISHLPSKGYIGWWISGGLVTAVAVLTIMSRLGWLIAATSKAIP
jgi:hypothetical protein